MKPITLKEVLILCADALLENKETPQLYLKDGDNQYHGIYDIDLLDDRIRCNDDYWDYYKYILEKENLGDYQLFITDN